MQNPSLTHWKPVKRNVRYLTGFLDSGLVMKPGSNASVVLEGFCDTDWHQTLMIKGPYLGFAFILAQI